MMKTGSSTPSGSCSGSTSRKKALKLTGSRASRTKKPNGPSAKKASGLKQWVNRKKTMLKYLDGLKSAKGFMSEGGVFFLHTFVKPKQRSLIFAKLKEVDPEGLKELKQLTRTIRQAKKREKMIPLMEEVDKAKVAVVQANYESEGITRLRIVDPDGVTNIIATLKAAGYSIPEICEKLSVEPELVNLVKPEHVALMKKRLQEGIVDLADSKVFRDLADGKVTQETARADLIASRRRTVQLRAMEVGKRGMPPLPSDTRKKETNHNKFFGAVEAEGKEIPDDEEESG